MEIEKYTKFYHEDAFQAMKKQLPPLIKRSLEKRNRYDDCISMDELKPRNVIGPKKDEKIIGKHRVEFNKKYITITCTESVVSAEMTIMVENEIIGSISKKEGFPDKVIKALLSTVIKHIKRRK
jgi:hypothetical protein